MHSVQFASFSSVTYANPVCAAITKSSVYTAKFSVIEDEKKLKTVDFYKMY